MLQLLAVGAIVWVALGSLSAAERGRLLARGASACRLFLEHVRRSRAEDQWFRDGLRQRTRFALAVPAIVAAEITVYVLARVAGAGHGSRAIALDWGASFGPRTTNGEWWRLATSLLLQPSAPGVLVSIAALATAGVLIERYFGRLLLLATFLTCGILAGTANLWRHPVEICSGAAGSIFGLYGLLLGSLAWIAGRRQPAEPAHATEEGAAPAASDDDDLPIPAGVFRRLVPAAVLFVSYSLRNDGLSTAAEVTAVVAGAIAGAIVSRDATGHKPGARVVGGVAAVSIAAAAVLAFPVRGVADIWPEMDRLVAVERQTAGTYKAAYDKMRHGRAAAASVADIIDRAVLPPLQAAGARLKALSNVPAEQQSIVADAGRYVELRVTSWTLRAEGLRKTGVVPEPERDETTPSSNARWRLKAEAMYRANTARLARAEAAERSALETLERLDRARPQW